MPQGRGIVRRRNKDTGNIEMMSDDKVYPYRCHVVCKYVNMSQMASVPLERVNVDVMRCKICKC